MRYLYCLLTACVVMILFIGCQRTPEKMVYPDFNPYAVSKIVFDGDNGRSVAINRISCKQWTVTENGKTFMADCKRIHSFVSMVAEMKQLPPERKPKPGSPEKCKGGHVNIEANGTYSFYVKKTGALYQSSYILLDGTDKCIRVEPFMNCVINLPLQKWIKKSVFDSNFDSLSEIKILHLGSPVFHIVRDPSNSDWIDKLHGDTTLPSSKVSDLYALLHKMKVYTVALDKGANKNLFSKKQLEIQVRDKESQCISTFLIGAKKNSSFYYARRSEQESAPVLFSSIWVEKLECAISQSIGKDFQLSSN